MTHAPYMTNSNLSRRRRHLRTHHDALIQLPTWQGLCCTNPMRDSSFESSMVDGMHDQTYTPNLQDQELASLQ